LSIPVSIIKPTVQMHRGVLVRKKGKEEKREAGKKGRKAR
jgi:hypothetical protein